MNKKQNFQKKKIKIKGDAICHFQIKNIGIRTTVTDLSSLEHIKTVIIFRQIAAIIILSELHQAHK